MKKWEYQYIRFHIREPLKGAVVTYESKIDYAKNNLYVDVVCLDKLDMLHHLKGLGAEGWELIEKENGFPTYLCLFKREKE